MINYSIIIPHYNIPHLLQRALDSIPQREDIEIIIVDDKSSSDKVDFENFPGLGRPNTYCVFLQKNGGAGIARNTAIAMAKGKWILCLDADDFLMPDAFTYIDRYLDSDSDVVVFKADRCLSEDISRKGQRHDAPQLCQYIDECISGQREVRNLLFSIWTPTCKLVKREMLVKNNIAFATIPVAEDVIWATGVAVHCHKAEVSSEYIYCITEREGSLTSGLNVSKLRICCDVFHDRNEYLHKYGYDSYRSYLTYEELFFVRSNGAWPYLQFTFRCLHFGILRPCTMYDIESRLHFHYPYLYLFLGLLKFPKINQNTLVYKLWKKMR